MNAPENEPCCSRESGTAAMEKLTSLSCPATLKLPGRIFSVIAVLPSAVLASRLASRRGLSALMVAAGRRSIPIAHFATQLAVGFPERLSRRGWPVLGSRLKPHFTSGAAQPTFVLQSCTLSPQVPRFPFGHTILPGGQPSHCMPVFTHCFAPSLPA